MPTAAPTTISLIPRFVRFNITQAVGNVTVATLNTTAFVFAYANVTGIPSSNFIYQSKFLRGGDNNSVTVMLVAGQRIAAGQIAYRFGNFSAAIIYATQSGNLLNVLRYYSAQLHIGSMNNISTLAIPELSYSVQDFTGTPTAVPVSVPTATPTIASYTVVPAISRMTATAVTKNSVTLMVLLSSSIDNAGTVSCSALSTPPGDVGILKVSPYLSTYSTVASAVYVLVSGLTPLTNQTFYCAVVTTYGYVSSVASVLSVTAKATTACCYSIVLSAAPTSVYGDATKYSAGSTSNVFVFQLSSVPKNSVTISPLVYSNSLSLAVLPANLTFTSKSGGKLTGQFYVNGNSSNSGLFNVILNVSGPDIHHYSPPATIAIDIMASNSPSLPPNPSLCIFDDSGTFVSLTFDRATDLGSISASTWTCSKLLTFPGVYSATCSWVNSSALKIVSSQLNVTGSVKINPSVLKAACSPGTDCGANYYAGASYITVQGPYNPLTPVIVFKVPSKVSLITSLIIDVSATTGHGGRDWASIYWSVASTVENDDVNGLFAEYLNNQTSLGQRIIVPQILDVGVYTVSLTVTNFLGGVDSESVVITAVDDGCLPTVSFKGSSSLTSSLDSALTILGSASLPSGGIDCVGAVLSYTWSVALSAGITLNSIKSQSATPSKFYVPAYTFNSSYSYLVTLNVTTFVSGVKRSASSSQASLFVTAGAVVASIAGKTFIGH
jgi:hypothetical protein